MRRTSKSGHERLWRVKSGFFQALAAFARRSGQNPNSNIIIPHPGRKPFTRAATAANMLCSAGAPAEGSTILEPSLAQTLTPRILARLPVKTSGVVLATVLATACAGVNAIAAAPQHVGIRDGEFTLRASLYRPEGAGPFSAVIALHDCGGLAHHRPIAETRHYIEWAHHLAARGFVVLLPDSFGSRGLGPQCRERNRRVRASRERIADANAARRWLQTQSFVKPDHISLLGWSNGGVAALWAVRPTRTPRDGGSDFRSAVTLYPGCRRLRETAWSARVPTLILIGGADDWTPAAVCQQMVAGARDRSARVQIVIYPGAPHEFDRVNSPLKLHTGLVNTADPSGRAHAGSNPQARADAFRRVPEWLER
jgi:dienelactone hydrolase